MRRIQIYLDEGVDDALQAEAARSGRSKAALIRECVAAHFGLGAEEVQDPLDALVGAFDVAPAGVDDIVYGSEEAALEVAERPGSGHDAD